MFLVQKKSGETLVIRYGQDTLVIENKSRTTVTLGIEGHRRFAVERRRGKVITNGRPTSA